MKPTILWFRQDLRLQDNPALHAAVKRGAPVVPVFIIEKNDEERWKAGRSSRWWLMRSLDALNCSLRERASRLVVKQGETGSVLRSLVNDTGADALYWNRRYEPNGMTADAKIRAEFNAAGVDVRSFNAALLHEPQEVANKQGRPFQVFTPFWRHCLMQEVPAPQKLQEEVRIMAPGKWPVSDRNEKNEEIGEGVDELGGCWQPGETSARKRLRRFVESRMDTYDRARDLPSEEGTSRLSPHLHFGEISPRQIWAAVKARSRSTGVFPPTKGASVFLSELGWREFAYHLLFHFPHTPERPLREEFAAFPWAQDPAGVKLRAWQSGKTGYPIVDAGMREMAETGWMHNRVRMIVASFLVKHLRLPWVSGAEWFWESLVDADLANNTLGWQWSAGCGADASPYFRIFAPVLQGQKFDAAGVYVRRWLPELAKMPRKFVHAPWSAPEEVLRAAGVRLGENYPRPIVDHATARTEALAAFQAMKEARG